MLSNNFLLRLSQISFPLQMRRLPSKSICDLPGAAFAQQNLHIKVKKKKLLKSATNVVPRNMLLKKTLTLNKKYLSKYLPLIHSHSCTNIC